MEHHSIIGSARTDFPNNAKVMVDENAFEVDNIVNPDDDMTSSLRQICGTEPLETSIEDARNKKKTIDSKIDSVFSLMNEVEYQEKALEQTKVEAAQIQSDIMLKVHELEDKQQHVEKKNVMLVGEAYIQKKILSAKMETLQLNVMTLLDKSDRSLGLLDEMKISLETKLVSIMTKKKLAIKKKKENEEFAREALAYEIIQLEKVEEDSKRLKQEASEISKLQELLIDREHLVSVLHGEISEKCQDLKLLKEELDRVVEFSETDIKKTHGVADIDRCIKKVKIKGKTREYRLVAKCIKKVKIKDKLQRNKMFAKSIKKVNNKRKLNGNQLCTKSNKKLNLKRKRRARKICAKICKKLEIKGVWHGSQMCAKNIKNSKIKGELHGSQICAKSIKKLKIKGKRHGSQMCKIKNLKINGKLHESQMCNKSVKKVNIKSKLHGNHVCPKSIKKAKIMSNQQEGQMCAKSTKKVKIKGLRVAKKSGQLQITDAM